MGQLLHISHTLQPAGEQGKPIGTEQSVVLLAVDIHDAIGRPIGVDEMIETRLGSWLPSFR